MPFAKCYYHLVWATKYREPLITDSRVEMARQAFAAIATKEGMFIHAIGIMPDHVHLALAIPPRLSVSDAVKDLKGLSSRRLNASAAEHESFAWQPEYGVLTFGDRSLEEIVAYVTNQREIHANRQIRPIFELDERPFCPETNTRSHDQPTALEGRPRG
jgi:REP element-mobilizing transposase RayT